MEENKKATQEDDANRPPHGFEYLDHTVRIGYLTDSSILMIKSLSVIFRPMFSCIHGDQI